MIILQVDSTQRYTEDGKKLCAIASYLPQTYKKVTKRLKGEHSNNYAEVAAILDVLYMLHDVEYTTTIETDSQVAWGWIIKNWKIHNSTLEKEQLSKMIDRCKELLAKNSKITLRKISRKNNMSDLSTVPTEELLKLEAVDI